MFGRTSRFGRGIQAATRQRHDHRLATGQAHSTLVGVLEGAADLGDAVNPGLELGGYGEVVQRRTNHHHVGGQELADKCFGHGVLLALGFGGSRLPGAKTQGVRTQVGRCVGGHVQVVHLGAGVAGRPGGHDVGGELARHGVGAQDAGVDVEQLHGSLLSIKQEPRCVADD